MVFRNAGYFPRYVVVRPDWLKDPRVSHIRSVSLCISPGPTDWISAWRHNALGLYDTPELAAQIRDASIGGAAAPDAIAEIHGYRVADTLFDEGEEEASQLPLPEATEIPNAWVRLGYDAVSRSLSDHFECSPLTCNGRAPDFEVNQHGLLHSAQAAREAARSFSLGGAEPGRYHVLEVWAPRALVLVPGDLPAQR